MEEGYIDLQMTQPKDSHRWGKNHHFTAGLQFNHTGFDQKRKYVVICM